MNPFWRPEVGLRLWVGPAIIVAAAVLLALLADWQAPRYQQWKGGRALAAGRAALARGDLRTAEVSLDIALHTRGDADTYDTLADYLERIGSERALEARLRAVAATPRNLERRFAVAETALRLGDPNAARDTLDSFTGDERRTERFERIAAAQAVLVGDFGGADAMLAALEPATARDPGLRLIRDAVWARSSNPARRGAAARDLAELSAAPRERLAALRIRVATAFRERDRLSADSLGQALAATPGASFGDLLDAAAAESFGRASKAADAALVAQIRERAAGAGPLAVNYSRWLAAEEGGASAAAWLNGLPAGVGSSAEVQSERARLAADRGDWTALRPLLVQGAWGSEPMAAVDLAYAAFALHRRGNRSLAERAWSEALNATNGDPSALDGLGHLVAVWRWPEGLRLAFSEALRRFPGMPGLYRRYATYLRMQRDTRGLLDLAGAGGVPAGDSARTANWALLCYLVEPATAPHTALASLAGLCAQHPDNPSYLTDYAFALWRTGRTAEAAAAADRLTDADRSFPDRAPYLAAIYAGAGRWAEARAALARAPRASAMLPEEAKLVADAYAQAAR